ncbi:hypothetical protein, partial [Oribacterium parvum]|uniref:hypothetical protein n=1 Tax=Oribacterium parvum TaxID=1501329 RepID=UPI0028E3E419
GSSANRGRCFSIFNPADTLAKLFWSSLTTLFGNSVTTLFIPGAIKERRGRFIPFLILLRLGLNF